jgi:class 3 adenylate cyclase/predicted ATPase
MFVDLVGSTALSARLDPEDMREIIGAYHRCCAEQITKAGGFVAKYMGDGVLAYFGYPQAHEDDAERAVRASLALIEAVPKLRAHHDAGLQLRVGVATGLVVVGDLIGEGVAQEHGVVGDTSNLAARLQALAEPGQVVISQGTRRLTGGVFEYRDLGKVALKGLVDPAHAWQVLRVSPVESRFEAQHGASLTPLVGREEELELLLRRWQQAKAGSGCGVLISGEPGIGKSRIVQALLERLGAQLHTPVRQFCSPHHQDTALHPTITQLERAAGFRREDTNEQRLEKLEAILAQVTNDLSEAVPLLAQVLSVPTDGRYPALDLTPQRRKEKTFNALIAQLAGLAARQPVVMVYEDAHWIDPTSLELLDLTIDRVQNLPILLIITFRPEFASPWIGRSHVIPLLLNRLPPRQRIEMVAHVTEGKMLPKEVADQIVQRTDGIPLFIEELTKAVVESGELADAGDRYTVARSLSPLTIPTTLHASLLARLDRSAAVREVAQIGSALGRQFSHELISAVATMPQKQLDDGLSNLVSAELIFRRGTPPDAEYTFKHALVQDAAYSTLLRGRRQQLHARVAQTIETQFPEIAAAQPQLMAEHCGEAGSIEKAISYWMSAGQQALSRSTFVEATTRFQKGLGLLVRVLDEARRDQLELELRMALGRALAPAKGYADPAVGANVDRARSLAEQLRRLELVAPLAYAQFAFHVTRAEHKLALASAEQVERVGEAQKDDAVRLLGTYVRGFVWHFRGEFTSACGLFERCQELKASPHRALYATMTAEDPYAVMLATHAASMAFLGCRDKARTCANEALAEARRLEHAHTLALVLCWNCWIAWVCGLPDDAKQHAQELAALSDRHDLPLWVAWASLFRGWSLAALGQPQEGIVLLKQGLAAHRATGALISTAFALVMLADAQRRGGQQVEALERLGEATEIVRQTDERYAEAELFRLRGELLRGKGERGEAELSYVRAIDVARKQSAKTFELRAGVSLARLWRDQAKRSEARDLLAPIYGWFSEGFDTPDLKEAKALLEELS